MSAILIVSANVAALTALTGFPDFSKKYEYEVKEPFRIEENINYVVPLDSKEWLISYYSNGSNAVAIANELFQQKQVLHSFPTDITLWANTMSMFLVQTWDYFGFGPDI